MQTSYNYFPGAAVPGMAYDAAGDMDVVTRTSTVAQPFGIFLVKDIGDGNVLAPSAAPSSSSVVEGVTLYTQDIQSGLAGDGVTPAYAAGRPINCFQKGRIWVQCETAFNPDTDVLYLRYTANGAGKVPGYVGNASDGGKNALLGVGGFLVPYKVLNTLTAAGLLAIQITLPGTQH